MTTRTATATATLGIALTAGLATQAVPAGAALPGQAGAFALSAPVPHAAGSLPLYRLSRTAAPSLFVQSVVGGAGLALRSEGSRLVARDPKGVLHAYSDPARGEAQIFPDLSARGGHADLDAMNRTEAAVFSRGDIVPHDATTFSVGAQTVISSADATAPGQGRQQSVSQPQQLFTYVSALRQADGLPVYGIGSKATVGIGPDGSVRALVRRWQAARQAGSVAPALNQGQVVSAIRGQMAGYLAAGDSVDVKSIKLAYYDGDASYLQPIYFFEAGIRTPNGMQDAAVGYVPFGKTVEPIVSLAAPGAQAMPAGIASGGGNTGGIMDGGSSQISLGEYANDDGQTVSQGNALLAGLETYGGGIYGPPINRTQYYWATPAAYVGSSAQSYINAVQVAHTPPHGDWYVNTTNSNDQGFFYITNIGTGGNPGYGAASGGKLATWIMDSCENAPSYYDMQVTTGNGNNAFTNWWPVFQGLHHLLAYRTMMFINQTGFDQQFGKDAETGTNIASAWYNDDASWYAQYNGYTYLDAHLNLNVHYGRVSIFQDTRNESETIYNVQGQSASGNLNNSWMNN